MFLKIQKCISKTTPVSHTKNIYHVSKQFWTQTLGNWFLWKGLSLLFCRRKTWKNVTWTIFSVILGHIAEQFKSVIFQSVLCKDFISAEMNVKSLPYTYFNLKRMIGLILLLSLELRIPFVVRNSDRLHYKISFWSCIL